MSISHFLNEAPMGSATTKNDQKNEKCYPLNMNNDRVVLPQYNDQKIEECHPWNMIKNCGQPVLEHK